MAGKETKTEGEELEERNAVKPRYTHTWDGVVLLLTCNTSINLLTADAFLSHKEETR